MVRRICDSRYFFLVLEVIFPYNCMEMRRGDFKFLKLDALQNSSGFSPSQNPLFKLSFQNKIKGEIK